MAAASTPGILWCGDSHIDVGNYNNVGPISNGPTWAQLVNGSLGYNTVGRWMTGGTTPGNYGQFYAIAGNGIKLATSNSNPALPADESVYGGQYPQILADYPSIPSNYIICLEAGFNDITSTLSFGGGMWSQTTYTVTSGGFNAPAVNGTVTVTVNTTTGLSSATLGTSTFIIFPASLSLFAFTGLSGSNVTLTNTGNVTPGTVFPANATFQAYSYFFNSDALSRLQTIVTNLQLFGATKIVLITPVLYTLTPNYASQNATFATNTSTYWLNQLQTTYPAGSVSFPSVTIFDANAAWQTIFNSPLNYGIRNVSTDYLDDGSHGDIDGYMWYNSLHPTAALHRNMAMQFFSFLKGRGYIPLWQPAAFWGRSF